MVPGGRVPWYKDAIFYELHVRSFFDGNGDGIGDFAGLISKLGYLQQLGVTALWLLPFYPSPLRDDGYDVSSYTGVHPSYGNLRDAAQLKVNPLRPGRLEPRALKGGHRRFPYMTLPRAQLKSQLRARHRDTT